MSDRYAKTDVGRAEIRARVHALSRTARNLLLIIDPGKDGAEWVRLVQGASLADLQTLLDAGLVAAVGPAAAASSASTSGAAVPAQGAPAQARAAQAAPAGAPDSLAAVTASAAASPTLSYSDLYDLLPSLAKQHLGLIKGYRFALAIERAEGLPGLQKLAQELVGEVESSKGAAVSQSVRRALLLP